MGPKSGPLSDIDTIPYDAPLTFEEPSEKWKNAMGGFPNNRGNTLTEADVPPVDLKGKWIIVTGGNSGIGREAALTFARWGGNVVLACRDPPPHEKHPKLVVQECIAQATFGGYKDSLMEWWEYNATDLSTVDALGKRWLDTGRPLDILCNNAGMGSSPGGFDVFKTKDGFEIIHQVNFLSHVLLTLRLLPALAKAKAPRIVCTTSCFHFLGKYNIANFNGGVGQSGEEGVNYYKNNKLYFQIWLTEMQHRLLQHNQFKHITINGFHPGFVNSGIWNLNRSNISWAAWLKGVLVQTVAYLFGITNQQGSMGMVYVATAPECGPDPKIQGGANENGKGGGRYWNRIWEQESMPHCRDRDARLRVWRKVNEELELQDKGLLDVLGLYSEAQL